jgi:hypothetical protein
MGLDIIMKLKLGNLESLQKRVQNNSLLIMKSENFTIRDKIAAFDYGSTLFWNNCHWYHP